MRTSLRLWRGIARDFTARLPLVIHFASGVAVLFSTGPESPLVRFGSFQLDLSRRELLRNGHRVRVQEQPFAVLAALLEAPGELVTRETLHRSLWSADRLVDFDHGLNNAIKRLRESLHDSAENPIYIETVPRSGYRFIAPVSLEERPAPSVEASAHDEPQSAATVTLPRPPGALSQIRFRYAAAAASVLIAVLIAVGWILLSRSAPVGEVSRIVPVTSYPGDERQPSLSPDGRQVAFSWRGENDDNQDIYIALLGERHPLRLTTDPAEDGYPAWSPDGQQIAFVRRRAGTRAEIVLISSLGGRERVLKQIRLGAWISGRMLAWSPDGTSLCFVNEAGASGRHALFLLSLHSGEVRQLLPEQDNGEGDSSPAFSPDGRWLAFGRFIFPRHSELLVQQLSRDFEPVGAPLPIKGAGVNPKEPVWLQDSKRLLFIEGSRLMTAEVGALSARPFYVSSARFDGLTRGGLLQRTRLVASLYTKADEIWSISLDAKKAGRPEAAERMVPSTAGETHPFFSADGRYLAFRTDRSGGSEIWLADSTGANPRQLTYLSAYVAGYPHWSPDSQFIVFHARFPGEAQLYIVRVADGATRQVTHGRPGFQTPSWSLDGLKLYSNALVNGETFIYSVPAEGGVPRQLWEGAEAVEAPGRHLLIYDKEDKAGIFARSLLGDATKNPERLLVPDFYAPWGGFQAFEDGLYYVGYTPAGRPRAFRYYSFQTGKSVDIAPSPANLDMGVTVTPDRRRLAFGVNDTGSADLFEIDVLEHSWLKHAPPMASYQ